MLRDGWRPAWEHHRFYPRFIPILGQRPSDARRLGALQVLVNRAVAGRRSPRRPTGLSENDWSAGARGLRFRQFKLFQKWQFGRAESRRADPFQTDIGSRYS